jgi:hypothetical protein
MRRTSPSTCWTTRSTGRPRQRSGWRPISSWWSSAGGAFSVVSVILTDWGRIASFTYTPAAAGAVTISVTDSGGLTDPPPIILTVSELVVVDEDITHGPIVMLHPAGMPAGTWSRWEGGPR